MIDMDTPRLRQLPAERKSRDLRVGVIGGLRQRLAAVRREDSDNGTYVVELVLWTPALVLLLMLAVSGGRIVAAGNHADEASRDAARAASLTYSMPQARTAATTAARAALGRAGITCTDLDVTVTGTVRPGGMVTARVRCTADLSEIAIPGIPGAKTLTGTSSAPVEITRSRMTPVGQS